ncbi:RluA family pseudouridine synthase [bacterium]|nr:RluA family pseudouridine synthase [bacterium]
MYFHGKKNQGLFRENQHGRIIVHNLQDPARLDHVMKIYFPQSGRRNLQTLISKGKVYINGKRVLLCSWLVRNGDCLELLSIPAKKPQPPDVFDDAWIIAQEEGFIVVNKPAGLLSEPARWTKTISLLDLAIKRFGPLNLFHRLDRDTSGVLILTRGGLINHYLDSVFKEGMVIKEYLAVVSCPNQLALQGLISNRIGTHPRRHDMMVVVEHGGKPAITRYEIIGESEGRQWVRLFPETGRTHQLRLHMAFLGSPILGDRLYGHGRTDILRLMLHAYKITLPEQEGFPSRIYTAPLPEDFLVM